MEGTYKEKLPYKGELQITGTDWSIMYMSRPLYRGDHDYWAVIPGLEIYDYIEAWRQNYNEFLKLKGQVPDGGEFSKRGAKDMIIEVGGKYFEGVKLATGYVFVSTNEELESIIADYSYAIKRAAEILSLDIGKQITPEVEDADKHSDPAKCTMNPEAAACAIVENYLYGLNDFIDLGNEKKMTLHDIEAGLQHLKKIGVLKEYSFNLDWDVDDDELYKYTEEGKE